MFLPGGGGLNDTMTLHDYGYLPPEFKELPYFGEKFSNIHPALESGFLPEIFSGGGQIYCYANLFCYANFSIVFKLIFGGRGKFPLGGKLPERKASSQPNNVSKHRNELFSKETLTNSCTVCHIITINMLKTSKLGLISWTKGK